MPHGVRARRHDRRSRCRRALPNAVSAHPPHSCVTRCLRIVTPGSKPAAAAFPSGGGGGGCDLQPAAADTLDGASAAPGRSVPRPRPRSTARAIATTDEGVGSDARHRCRRPTRPPPLGASPWTSRAAYGCRPPHYGGAQDAPSRDKMGPVRPIHVKGWRRPPNGVRMHWWAARATRTVKRVSLDVASETHGRTGRGFASRRCVAWQEAARTHQKTPHKT